MPKSYVGVKLKAGEELGMFRMGSTIVMIAEVPQGFAFELSTEQKVRFGDVVGRVQ